MQQPQSTGFMLLQKHNALPCRCTETQFSVFVRGVDAVLQQWTALLLVCQHRDDNALSIIREEVLKWFWEDGEVYSDELEEYFNDFFESVRYVVVEDGSCKEVSDVLHNMYTTCAKDDGSIVEHYVATLPVYQQANPVKHSVFGGNWEVDAQGQQVNVGGAEDEDEDDGDDGEDGEVDIGVGGGASTACAEDESDPLPAVAQQAQPLPPKPKQNKKNPFQKSNDGWCTVQRKK